VSELQLKTLLYCCVTEHGWTKAQRC